MCCVTVLHVLVVYWYHALWSFLQRRSLNVGGHSFTVSLSSWDRFQKTHLLPFRKTWRCQRYNNERGRRSLVRTTKNGVQPPGIQSVLEELTPVPEAGLTSAAVPVLWPAEEGNSCCRSIRNHETQRACRARKASHPESGWELVVRNISASEGPAFLAAYLTRFGIYASVYNFAINLTWNYKI